MFYRALAGQKVRVGMEASGHARWFERLLGELQFELWIGDAAEIRTKRVRKQKTDRQDAQLILRLLLEDRFPQIWVPSWENRDLRQLLWHRHRMVQARSPNSLIRTGKFRGRERRDGETSRYHSLGAGKARALKGIVQNIFAWHGDRRLQARGHSRRHHVPRCSRRRTRRNAAFRSLASTHLSCRGHRPGSKDVVH